MRYLIVALAIAFGAGQAAAGEAVKKSNTVDAAPEVKVQPAAVPATPVPDSSMTYSPDHDYSGYGGCNHSKSKTQALIN